ncbi:uS10/mL48 family ribosomal protein [Halapricum hydrolyticum]|uniref:Small ribosomal subunit protein uS10 n=1 Tax=Halapricum hydrolyticum TaxID=2979991 RepID=A0AAE3LJC0_9EURY|nr:uS10/mL48 family ribosomal protein [Halapricum hydrolyticum]MCU4717993.1 uS10/mL48 family ribosomal protein [Halapricum hydrolyticum]MCU4727158.1 uS10/mL48 family ribosomal protein [Halapricum hydrolyticum]
MPFVTKLTFESGDRHLLEEVVREIKADAARKGVEHKGPHPQPPDDIRVPQSKTLLDTGGEFDAWNYTVYTRTIEIVGHDEFARSVAGRDLPAAISVEVEVEQRRGQGHGD